MTESIAIVYALREEMKPILQECRVNSRILQKPTTLTHASFREVPIVLCQTGIGLANARAGVEYLLRYLRPSLILSAGCAGAANGDLKTGDLVLPLEIRTETPSECFETDVTIRGELERLIREEEIVYQTGPLATRSKLVGREEKEAAGRMGMAAVDMETSAVASVAQNAKVPFASLRVVFDPMVEEMPISEPFDEDRPVSFLAKNPKMFLKLPKYSRWNQICQKNLARVLARFIDCYGAHP